MERLAFFAAVVFVICLMVGCVSTPRGDFSRDELQATEILIMKCTKSAPSC